MRRWVASSCLERGDPAGATSHYLEILKLFPTDPVAKATLRELSPSLQPETPDRRVSVWADLWTDVQSARWCRKTYPRRTSRLNSCLF
jgi:hypothetical protein